MKKIAVLFNTDRLGGAERSMLLQLSEIENASLTFYIPIFSIKSEIEEYILNNNLGEIIKFNFPKELYLLSRNHIKLGFKMLTNFYSFVFGRNAFDDLENFDHIYINGNKSAFLFFAKNWKMKFKGKITWHWRDYYFKNKYSDKIWKMISWTSFRNLSLVCNSNSVRESLLNSPFSSCDIEVVYNPSGQKSSVREIKEIKSIGIVSMMAPWKGIHEIVYFAWLYEDKLKQLGIEEIKVFGDDLYYTEGEHQNYKNDLQKMFAKFPSTILKFEGLKSPDYIFKNIDCLIHYSLRPEPFGRVLIEAFDSGVPVISTGLGGAYELIENGVNGFIVPPFDRQALFDSIASLARDNFLVFDFVSSSKNKSQIIQKDIKKKMLQVLTLEEAS